MTYGPPELPLRRSPARPLVERLLMANLADCDVIVLCGASAPGCNPSYPTVPNRWRKFGRPFVSLLVEYLRHGRASSFSIWVISEMIEDFVSCVIEVHTRRCLSAILSLSAPEGALAHAMPFGAEQSVSVLNGDSFPEIDPQRLLPSIPANRRVRRLR